MNERETSPVASARAEKSHTPETQIVCNSDARGSGVTKGPKHGDNVLTDGEKYQRQNVLGTVGSSDSSAQEECEHALAHQEDGSAITASFQSVVEPQSDNAVCRWKYLRIKYGKEHFRRFSFKPSSTSSTSLGSAGEKWASMESAQDIAPIVLDTSPPIQRRRLFVEEDINCIGRTTSGTFFDLRRFKGKRDGKSQGGDDDAVGSSGQINDNRATLPRSASMQLPVTTCSKFHTHSASEKPINSVNQSTDTGPRTAADSDMGQTGRSDNLREETEHRRPNSRTDDGNMLNDSCFRSGEENTTVASLPSAEGREMSGAKSECTHRIPLPIDQRHEGGKFNGIVTCDTPLPTRIPDSKNELSSHQLFVRYLFTFPRASVIYPIDETICGKSQAEFSKPKLDVSPSSIRKAAPEELLPNSSSHQFSPDVREFKSGKIDETGGPECAPTSHPGDVISSSPSTMAAEQEPKLALTVTQTRGDESVSPAMSDAEFAAKKIWEGDEIFVASIKAAEFLGKPGEKAQRILQSYFEKYDFTGQRIDAAFRAFCSRLYLKAESQQIDRILAAFSRRYHNCNPTPESMAPHPFLNEDEIHTITYSLLLLNTDLHVAAIGVKMSRSEYVKNTIRTLSLSSQIKKTGVDGPRQSSDGVITTDSINSDTISSIKSQTSQKRWSMPWGERSFEDGNSQLHATAERVTELSNMLKELYSSIKAFRILHPEKIESSLSPGNGLTTETLPSSTASSPGPSNSSTLPRSFFSRRLVRAPSSPSFSRLDYSDEGLFGRGVNTLLGRSGSNRGGPLSTRRSMFGSTLQGEGGPGGSSVSSSPILHPSMRPPQSDHSATSSLHERKFSASTFNSMVSRNTLESGADMFSEEPSPPVTSQGIMEGILIRKHYLERENKKASGRTWKKSYVFFDNVELQIFNSTASGKEKYENSVITLCILHSLANALPPPGYSRNRPHVFALTLPTGCVYLFQAASMSLVQDWVTAINLQAARTSKEPLPAGITNFEYGWGRILDEVDENGDPSKEFVEKDAHIREWKAPLANVLAVSQLDEAKQLQNLQKQLVNLEAEIERHHKLREKVDQMIPIKSKSYGKAIFNWEKRSQHLLREHVKYQVYADNLQRAVEDSTVIRNG